MKNFQNYVSLDLETTGLDPHTCDIIEVAMVKVRDGQIIDRFESFVFTPLEISQHVSYLTGITAQDIEDAPDFINISQKIESFIGDDPLMGHNIWFDWNFLVQKGVKLDNNELWDTYIMSNILYPELPSHSLETNTKYFGISHEDSHRAMADVMACYELWKILTDTFPELSSEQSDRIKLLADKSSWPLISYFLQDNKTSRHDLAITDTNYYHPQECESLDMSDADNHVFVLARGREPVDVLRSIKLPGRTLYIAGYEHSLQKIQQVLPEAFWIHGPQSYLSKKKIAHLWEKDSLEPGETYLLLKTILNPELKTQKDLVLSHPERSVWQNLNCFADEDPEDNYLLARKESEGANQVIASHFQILHDLNFIKGFDHIVILEPQLLESNATRVFGEYLHVDQWLSKSEDEVWIKYGNDFFDALSGLAHTIVPSSQYPEHLLLHDGISSSNEFIRLHSLINEVVNEINEPDLASYLKYYQAFFNTGDSSWIRWITVDPRKGVSLNLAPLSVKPLLNKYLFQKIKSVLISDTADEFSFLPETKLIELPNPQNLKIYLPPLEEVVGTKKDGDHLAMISYLSENLPSLNGKTGLIFSSKTQLKRYFFDLVKVLGEDICLLAEDLSGGTGKLIDRYLSADQEKKVMFLSYRNLRSFAPEVLDFDQIIIQSLPFDPPGFPVHQMRSNQFANGFAQYTIPRTQLNLLEIVTNFSKRPGQKQLIVIDRRAQEKSYGQEILEVLE